MKEILQITPGKCRAVSQDVLTKARDADWVMEEKIDGHRGLLHFGKDLDRAYLTSKRVSSVTELFSENGENVPHILNEIEDYVDNWGMGYTVIDGEVVVEGRPFEDVQSVMGSKPEKAILWQEENVKATFIVYDILWVDGEDVREEPYYKRVKTLWPLIRRMKSRFIKGSSGRSTFEGVQLFFEEVTKAGGEGIVIKDLAAKYGKGVWKMKGEDTFDVVITGFQEGKGKFQKLIGAVEFSCWDGEKLVRIGTCSGMSDGEVSWAFEGDKGKDSGNYLVSDPKRPGEPGTRTWFTYFRNLLIGDVIEVKASGITKHGKLRHPRFMRTREDKDKTMCPLPREQANKE